MPSFEQKFASLPERPPQEFTRRVRKKELQQFDEEPQRERFNALTLLSDDKSSILFYLLGRINIECA